MKVTISKRQKMVKVPLLLMQRIRDQLQAMNNSAVHAGSWVLPFSHATSEVIDAIDAALNQEGKAS